MARNYPAWICGPCGEQLGSRIPTCATWHEGDACGWCGSANMAVTEPRDFGYPPAPGIAVNRSNTPEAQPHGR